MDLNNVARKAASLDAAIKLNTKELAKLKKQLIAGGEADYGCVQVIFPAPSIKPADEVIDELKENLPREQFIKLFETVTVFKPVKAFREVLAAICAPKVCRTVLAQVQCESTPRVVFK